MSAQRQRLAVAGAVAPVALLYGLTACRYVLGSDSAEFAAVLARGGVPHPSGYPLYVLWLRAFAWLPTSPAHAASLATAVLGVVSVALVIWSAVRWGASVASASIAGLALGLSPIAWKLSTEPEAFALNATLAALIIGLCAPSGTPNGALRVALLGFTAGLGLSNHLTIVFLAPVGLFSLGHAFLRERAGVKAIPLGVLGLVLGLTPYLTFRFASPSGAEVWAWGQTGSWSGLLRHAIRADYGALQHGVAGQRDALGQLGLLGWTLLSGNALVWLAGLAGLVARRFGEGASRVGVVCLLVSLSLCGPVLVVWSNVSMNELALVVMERFHLMPMVPLAILTAMGLDAWRERLGERRALIDVTMVATAVASAALGWSNVRDHHRPTVELWTRSVLAYVPPNAVVMGTGDVRVFPFAYARVGLGLRPDVVYIDPWLLHYDWYQAGISRQLGYAIVAPVGKSVDTVAVAYQALSRGRPVFLTNTFVAGFDRKLVVHPAGPIFRVLPGGATVPPIEAIERDVAASETSDEPEPVDVGGWSGDLIEWRARGWLWIADAYGEQADTAGRLRAYERAKALAPWVVGAR